MMVYFSLAQERWNAFVYFETFLSLLQIFADVQKHHFFFKKLTKYISENRTITSGWEFFHWTIDTNFHDPQTKSSFQYQVIKNKLRKQVV